jgi:hypothetical protein
MSITIPRRRVKYVFLGAAGDRRQLQDSRIFRDTMEQTRALVGAKSSLNSTEESEADFLYIGN